MYYICSDVFGQQYKITASDGASSTMLQHNDPELTRQFISRLSIEPSRWSSIVSMLGASLGDNNRPQTIYQAVSQLIMNGRLCIHRQAIVGASSAIRITSQGSHVDKGLCLARGPNTNEPSTHNLVPIKDRAAAEQLLQGVDGAALSAGLHHNDLSEFATESHHNGANQKESIINALVAGDILAYLVDMPSASKQKVEEYVSTDLPGVRVATFAPETPLKTVNQKQLVSNVDTLNAESDINNADIDLAKSEGESSQHIEARIKVAQYFLVNNGFSESQITDALGSPDGSRVGGVDLTKPVEVISFPPPDTMSQHVKSHGFPGNWFDPFGSQTPSSLGISGDGRKESKFLMPVGAGLQSHAKPIIDTWTNPAKPLHTVGGGTQLFVSDKLKKQVLTLNGIG